MKFSPTKCTPIRFWKRSISTAMHPLFLNGQRLEPANCVRYLGIYLDSEMTWKPHVMMMAQRGRQRLQLIKQVSGRSWGFNPEAVWQLVTKGLEPALYYGAEAWYRSQLPVSTLAPLEKVMRLAGLAITGGLRTTSYSATYALAGILPPQLELDRQALYWEVRRRGSVSQGPQLWDTKTLTQLNRSTTFRRWIRSLPGRELFTIPQRLPFSIPPTALSLLPKPANQIWKESLPQWTLSIARFNANGGNWSGWAGLAWSLKHHSLHHSGSWKVPPGASVIEAMLRCLREGLEKFSGLVSPSGFCLPRSLGIVTGSSDLWKEVARIRNVSEQAAQAQEKFLELAHSGHTIGWATRKWGPGASPYMEARITAMQAFRTPVSPTLAIADINHQRKKIGQFLNSRVGVDLSNRNTGRSLLDLSPPLGKGKHLARGLSRTDTSRYNQFLSGHFPCRQYLARFKLSDGDEMCACSEAIESREHILESCSLFDEERAQLIREATKCGIPPDRLWEAAHLIAEFLHNITKKWTNRGALWRTLK